MDEPLDEQYLTWLYGRVASVKITNPKRTYWSLFRQLYNKEFVWIIPNDDNRVEDGKDLRYEFLEKRGINKENDPDWMRLGCSVLELIIGIARRLTFEADGSDSKWFWELMRNLGLDRYTDANYNEAEVDEILDDLIWRTYEPSGHGGLFPLREPTEDQRDVEIWYQLCAYILERV